MTQPATLSQPDPYGSDWLVTFSGNGNGDVDPGGAMVSGIALLAQSLTMAQTTPQGSLIGAQSECIDLRAIVSKGLTQAAISAIGPRCKNVILRDQRVTAVTVTPTWSLATSTLTLLEQLQSIYGPFSLTIGVSNVGVAMIYGV
jgi:hypothetical protein